LLVVHKNHAPLLRQSVADKNVKITEYRYGIDLAYDTHFNIRRSKTILNILKFVAYQWIKDFWVFKSAVKSNPPGVIVTDFLPYVAVWAKAFKIPSIGIYNYALRVTSFGEDFLSKVLEFVVPKIFKIAYKLPNKMFIESIAASEIPHTDGMDKRGGRSLTFDEPQSRPSGMKFLSFGQKFDFLRANVTLIPIIRRYPEMNDSTDSSKNYPTSVCLIALGGKSDPEPMLEFFKSVRRHAPELKFWIVPRENGEFVKTNGVFNIVSTDSPFSTFNVMQKVDGVITKAGFSTVAEALQLNKKLFIITLASHPEIQETANQLVEMGLAKPISLAMEPREVAGILTSPFFSSQKIKFGGENIVINEIEKYMI
jgi:hypothetical protein